MLPAPVKEPSSSIFPEQKKHFRAGKQKSLNSKLKTSEWPISGKRNGGGGQREMEREGKTDLSSLQTTP